MFAEQYRAILGVAIVMIFGVLLLLGSHAVVSEVLDKDAALAAVPTIEVLSKEIIPARSSFLFRRDMGYRLVGEIEYFYDGEHRVEEIKVEVDKEIFDSVSIGDTFNKHTYTVVTEN